LYFERHRDDKPSWLIPNAVFSEHFQNVSPARDQWGLGASVPVVLMVSALVPNKRVIEGIRAVAPMKQMHLLVAGDGPLRDQVDQEGRELLGSRFRRVTVPFDGMPSLYRSADMLLHMSQDEPFGNIYIEALAAGLPVVAHDWSSTRWLFEDLALLVDTDDFDQVRGALTLALQRKSPEERAKRLALVNRRFTWNAVAKEYAACIETVVSKATMQLPGNGSPS
jgi:glycosyltransferase involved in cell wall biosynthesis